jgi:hypothetical protein
MLSLQCDLSSCGLHPASTLIAAWSVPKLVLRVRLRFPHSLLTGAGASTLLPRLHQRRFVLHVVMLVTTKSAPSSESLLDLF